MAITKEAVTAALSTVLDPDLQKDLVTLNMIKELEVVDNQVYFKVVLTTPACPLKERIRRECEEAVRKVTGPATEIKIEMTSEVTSSRPNPELTGIKNVIAVASGKGGVGKSTVAANLAVSLAMAGAKVGLVDADIYGPSLPILFGILGERPHFFKKGDREWLVPFIKFGVKLNSIGCLVAPGQAVVWRGPMASKALKQLIFDTDWGELDYLVVDMPPGTGDVHLTLVQKLPVTGAIIVTTPQELSLADARKGAEMFRLPQINVPILGIVENMSYFSPPELPDKKYYLFGKGGGAKLAAEYQVPLLAELPIVEDVSDLGDTGIPMAVKVNHPAALAFRNLAEKIAQQIAIRNAGMPPSQKVEILYR